MALGTAGVVLSGNGQDLDDATDHIFEQDTDTGSDSSEEVEIDSDDVGGNTSPTASAPASPTRIRPPRHDGGTESSTSTENTTYGPGGIATGGNQSDSTTDNDSSTETVSDTGNGSNAESNAEFQAEAADSYRRDDQRHRHRRRHTTSETDTDSSSSGELDSLVLGAGG